MKLPMYVDATRVQFEAARDKLSFLLTVETSDSQLIEIRFPGWFAHEFAEQVANLAARFPKDQNHTPDTLS
jgi:hypothetical protein